MQLQRQLRRSRCLGTCRLRRSRASPLKPSLFGGAKPQVASTSQPSSRNSIDSVTSGLAGQSLKDGDDDVVVVREILPTAEQEQRAKALLLPRGFYVFENPEAVRRGVSEEEEEAARAASQQQPATAAAAPVSAAKTPGPWETKSVDATKAAPAASHPIAGKPATFASAAPLPEASTAKPAGGTAFSGVSTTTSFGSLAKTADEKPAWATGTTAKFAGAGQKLFTTKPKSPGKSKEAAGSEGSEEEGSANEAEEENTDVTYTPIVKLPGEVKVVTEEEDEEVRFVHRAKLYAWGEGNAGMQWKERGLGDVKLLQHKETGRVRLVMRREQVHKVAANHHLSGEMKLLPMPSSDSSFSWVAQDFTEGGEGVLEKFSIKFKDGEIAGRFRAAFEGCVGDVAKLESGAAAGGATKVSEPKAAEPKSTEPKAAEPKSEALSAKEEGKGSGSIWGSKSGASGGAWNCGSCYVENKADIVKCLSCGTLKAGATAPATAVGVTTATATSAFKFGVGKPAIAAGSAAAPTAVSSAKGDEKKPLFGSISTPAPKAPEAIAKAPEAIAKAVEAGTKAAEKKPLFGSLSFAAKPSELPKPSLFGAKPFAPSTP